MFDSTFFTDSLPNQVNEMGGHIVACELTVANGHKFRIQKIIKPENNGVWLAVFPAAGVNDHTRHERSQNVSQDVRWDRIAIPYHTIQEVLLTLACKGDQLEMGFHASR